MFGIFREDKMSLIQLKCMHFKISLYWEGGYAPSTDPWFFFKIKFYFKNNKFYTANQCVPRRHKNKHWSESATFEEYWYVLEYKALLISTSINFLQLCRTMLLYLRNTFVAPAVPRVFETVHQRGRHTDFPHSVSRWSGFHQQDPSCLIAASETVCQNTPRRTGTDDDIVIFVGISDTCRRRPPHGSVLPVVSITSCEFGTEKRCRNGDRCRRRSQWTILSWWCQCRHSSAYSADCPLLNSATVIPLYEAIPYLHFSDLPKMKHAPPLTFYYSSSTTLSSVTKVCFHKSLQKVYIHTR